MKNIIPFDTIKPCEGLYVPVHIQDEMAFSHTEPYSMTVVRILTNVNGLDIWRIFVLFWPGEDEKRDDWLKRFVTPDGIPKNLLEKAGIEWSDSPGEKPE